MTQRTIAGTTVEDGDRVSLTFQTPYRRSLGGRIPIEGTVEKTVEGTASVTDSMLKDTPPMFHIETDDGDRLTLEQASEFKRVEWENGRKSRISAVEDGELSGWVVGKKDDRAKRDEAYSVRGYVAVGEEPELEPLEVPA